MFQGDLDFQYEVVREGPWSQFVIQLSLNYHPYGQKRIGW